MKFPVKKCIFALLMGAIGLLFVTLTMANNVAVGTDFLVPFLIIVAGFLFMEYKIDDSRYLTYYFFNGIKILFYTLPLLMLVYVFVFASRNIDTTSGDLEAAAGALGTAIGGSMLIFLALIIGLVGGLIIGSFNKEPKVSDGTNTGLNQFLLLVIMIIAMSTF